MCIFKYRPIYLKTAFGVPVTKLKYRSQNDATQSLRSFRCEVPFGLKARFRGNGRNKDRYANPFGSRVSNFKSHQRPILLEKFVKLCLYEGSVMVRHPFTIKARGSYFDKEHNVDRERNKDLAIHRHEIRDSHWKRNMSEESIRMKQERDEQNLAKLLKKQFDASREEFSDSITELEESLHPSSLPASNKDKNTPEEIKELCPNISVDDTLLSNHSENSSEEQKYHPQMKLRMIRTKNRKLIVASSNEDSNAVLTDEEYSDDEEIDDEDYYDDFDEDYDDEEDDGGIDDYYFRNLDDLHGETVPMHVLFYGRNHHEIDSYSMDHHGKQQTHLYISNLLDAPGKEDDDEHSEEYHSDDEEPKRRKQHRVGNVSIWQPRDIYHSGDLTPRDDINHSWCEEDNFKHGFSLFCSQRVLDGATKDNEGLKTVFLLPTVMNKIDLQSDGTGNVELDANIIEYLDLVKLSSECGNIIAKDISAANVKLNTEGGDIYCHGLVEGEIVAETKGDGDFIAKHVGGHLIEITTQAGDITMWGDLKTDTAKLHSRLGQIAVHGTLYGSGEILQQGRGDVMINKVNDIGMVTACVRHGDIQITFSENMDASSLLENENGNIIISVPVKHNYRINAIAPRVNIASRLLNKGEIFLSEPKGKWEYRNQPMEIFTTSPSSRSEMETFFDDKSILRNASSGKRGGYFRNIDEPGEDLTLTLISHEGSLTVNVAQTAEEESIEKGFDSAT